MNFFCNCKKPKKARIYVLFFYSILVETFTVTFLTNLTVIVAKKILLCYTLSVEIKVNTEGGFSYMAQEKNQVTL